MKTIVEIGCKSASTINERDESAEIMREAITRMNEVVAIVEPASAPIKGKNPEIKASVAIAAEPATPPKPRARDFP